MVNYFDLFDFPVTFRIDEAELKKRFYRLSRAYHPDHFTMEVQDKQDEVSLISSQINIGYKILADEHTRIKYILELNGLLKNQENQTLPESFLLEMMDINERIFELQMDFEAATKEKVIHDIQQFEQNLKTGLVKYVDDFENQIDKQCALENIKDYYFKSKYLLRIKENLATFAGS